jgi:hypothetical protein
MGDVEWFRYMHTPVDLEKYFQQQQIKEKVEDIKVSQLVPILIS